ncbi:uncharacterized protein LOC143294537 isoform X2 [Babylonia areolata]
MTSSGPRTPTQPVPNIVWDKSRLHAADRAAGRSRKRTTTTPVKTTGNRPPPHPPPRSGQAEPELRMSFDPMKDLHMWTMWRVAVNGRIVDETMRRSRAQQPTTEGAGAGGHGDLDPNPYGRALVKTPLDRFIRVGNSSQDIAGVMMDPHGQGGGAGLQTRQFVYYGVPRVVLKKTKKVVHLP